jgi:hypothetical protein
MFDPARDIDLGNRPYWMRLGKVTLLALGACMALGVLLLHLAPHS